MFCNLFILSSLTTLVYQGSTSMNSFRFRFRFRWRVLIRRFEQWTRKRTTLRSIRESGEQYEEGRPDLWRIFFFREYVRRSLAGGVEGREILPDRMYSSYDQTTSFQSGLRTLPRRKTGVLQSPISKLNALSKILKQSFKLYSAMNDGIINLVDMFPTLKTENGFIPGLDLMNGHLARVPNTQTGDKSVVVLENGFIPGLDLMNGHLVRVPNNQTGDKSVVVLGALNVFDLNWLSTFVEQLPCTVVTVSLIVFSVPYSSSEHLGMEVAPCNVPTHDDEEKALAVLLDVFGSVFPLDQIASAYCKAGRDPDLAGQLLYNWQGGLSTSVHSEPIKEEVEEDAFASSSSAAVGVSGHADPKIRAPKQKGRPVSAGTVSSFLGKDYIKSKPVANGSSLVRKPLKLDANEWLVSDDGEQKGEQSQPVNENMQESMEDFLFKMLGNGFQMDREVIRGVLDKCGYNMQECMENLIDLSENMSVKDDKHLHETTDKLSKVSLKTEGSCVSENQPLDCSGSELALQKRNDLQKEVLAALFTAPERYEEPPRRIVRPPRRGYLHASREVVWKPPGEVISSKPIAAQALNGVDDVAAEAGEEDDEYQRLRRIVVECRVTMKEYYRSAVEAFTREEYEKADRLMEKGQFFHSKAQQADEESSNKLFETKYAETEDQVKLDLHEHDAKDAIRTLKIHLSKLSGISSIKYLKVIVETDEEDVTKGKRKRTLKKFLDRESISWTEDEGRPGIVMVRVDNVDRSKLSFAHKN
ncbi:Putative nuclear RNA export factor SDE5 [Linum perenne]